MSQYEPITYPLSILRVTVEHARGPRRSDRGGGGRRSWIDKYGPPTRTNYRVIVENLSSRVSWQVSSLSVSQFTHPFHSVQGGSGFEIFLELKRVWVSVNELRVLSKS